MSDFDFHKTLDISFVSIWSWMKLKSSVVGSVVVGNLVVIRDLVVGGVVVEVLVVFGKLCHSRECQAYLK